jgi:PilZ domain
MNRYREDDGVARRSGEIAKAAERRREHRVTAGAMRARMRPGYRLIVIDLSTRGALVEAGRPLRPGSHVDVHLETDARRGTVAARVVRCAVAAIDSESGVTYRAGLSFHDTCDWVREALTLGGHAVHGGSAGDAPPAAADVERLPPARGDAARASVKGAK